MFDDKIVGMQWERYLSFKFDSGLVNHINLVFVISSVDDCRTKLIVLVQIITQKEFQFIKSPEYFAPIFTLPLRSIHRAISMTQELICGRTMLRIDCNTNTC